MLVCRHDIVKVLLEAGADIQAVDCNNQTALHLATHLPVEELLGGGDARKTVRLCAVRVGGNVSSTKCMCL